jgi:ABC-type nitrate/sulfonate/bicarbonate transport system substrate-binding protein
VKLDVRLEEGGSPSSIQKVRSGEDDFGIEGADQILIARGNDNADVVPLLVIYQQTPFVLFTRSDGSIKTIKDIVGKRVGVKYGGNEELTYRAMLAAAGVDTGSIIEIPVRVDMRAFFNGDIDVWPGYSINEPLDANRKGVAVRTFSPDQLGIKMYADTLFTTGSQIKEKSDVVKGFVEATRRGWEYAIRHPDEAGVVTAMRYANSSSAHETEMMKASLPSLLPPGSHFGDMTLASWQSLQKMMLSRHFLDRETDIDKMLLESRHAQGVGK